MRRSLPRCRFRGADPGLRRDRPLPPTGEAVITPAFGIKTARYIIHAVGPVYSAYPADKARELLRSAYRSAIRLAAANACKSIAFPAISTGMMAIRLTRPAAKPSMSALPRALRRASPLNSWRSMRKPPRSFARTSSATRTIKAATQHLSQPPERPTSILRHLLVGRWH